MGQTIKEIRNLWIVGVGLLALAGCAQGVGTVDRTQPDYTKKSDLTGTWYWRDTVTKVPPTTSFTFVGISSNLEKIQWVIKEDRLYAYRSYELIPGAINVGLDAGAPMGPPGAPVASYAILSHFDIEREYNPATGEQTNVISENTTDRPWYEREYMHVNWADNILTNFSDPGSVFGKAGVADTVAFNGEGSNPSDPRSEFYTEYEPKSQQLIYFDFHGHYYVQPLECIYGTAQKNVEGSQAAIDCTSADIEVTSAFYRAPKSDYIPLPFSDIDMSRFGYFRSERLTYDPDYGTTESGRILLAARYNLWKQNHDSSGAVIPMVSREPKPIVYYLNPEFPPELMPAAKGIETTWDRAFRRVVAAIHADVGANVPTYDCTVQSEALERLAKIADPTHVLTCTDPFSATTAGLKQQFTGARDFIPWSDGPYQMVFVCPTPVPAGSPAACGPAGFAPRVGDIRHSFFYWVPDVQLAGPLGLGAYGADPETGEILSAGAYVYGAAVDTYAALSRDIVDVLSGEEDVRNFANGSLVQAYLTNHLNPADPRSTIKDLPASFLSQNAADAFASLKADPQRQWIQQVMQSASQSTGGWMGRINGLPGGMTQDQARQQSLQKFVPVTQTASQFQPFPGGLATAAPDIYGMLLGAPEIQTALASMSNDPAVQSAWSQDFYGSLQKVLQRSHDRETSALKANITLADFADDSVYGLAMEIKNQYFAGLTPTSSGWDAANAQVLTVVKNRIFEAVTDHEGGHTFGLRHNFEGSFDSLNYFPEYWQMRLENLNDPSALTVQQLLDSGSQTDNQKTNKMREYQYTSIMDYAAKFNSDIHGLGKYDEAAVLYAYSGDQEPGYVEVFDYVPPAVASDLPVTNTDGSGSTFGARYLFWLFGDRPSPANTAPLEAVHYTRFPAMMGDGATFQARSASGIANLNKRHLVLFSDLQKQLQDNDAIWGPALTSFIASKDASAALAALNSRPVPVPYMFASDEWTGFLPDCQTWDEGADYREQGSELVSAYQNYYWFNNYKRDRFGFNEVDVLVHNFQRYFSYFPRSYQNMLYRGTGDQLQSILWQVGVLEQFDMLNNVLMTPQYGSYAQTYTPATQVVSDYQLLTYDDLYGTTTPGTTARATAHAAAAQQLLQDQQAAAAEAAHNSNVNTANNCGRAVSDGAPPHGSSDDVWITWMETLPQTLHDRIPHFYGVSAGEASTIATKMGLSAPYDLAAATARVLSISEGDGKLPYSSFDANLGYTYFDKITRAGQFWDKYGAMLALSAANAQFLGVDTAANLTQFVLPYYDAYAVPLIQTFSGIYLEDPARFSARVTTDSQGNVAFQYMPAAALQFTNGPLYPAPPATTAPALSQGTSFTDLIYATQISMATFKNPLDYYGPAFDDLNNIYRLGSGEQLTPGAGQEVTTMTDPGTGYIYAAIVPTGTTGEKLSPAGIRIAKGNDAVSRLNAANAVIAVDPCDDHAKSDFAQAQSDLKLQVGFMNVMRELYGVYSGTQY